MYIKEKRNNYFLNLLENKESAEAYFQSKDIGEYNNSRLKELQEELESSRKKRTIMLSITRFFKIKNLDGIISKYSKKIEYDICKLESFEFDLAYLIISGKINIEDCCKENDFEPAYIIDLLEKCKKLVAKPFIEYYYDENTGKVSIITEDGKRLVLPYTPDVVIEQLNEQTELIQPLDDELSNMMSKKILDLSDAKIKKMEMKKQ